ncbi:transmembrane 4 L6 family member 4-like [Petaurus breviceps papuanus]|uniref:transmembrane 4 L6 family member 4-like n=1 Tax=Petaurus breviceps papuanus TaxID=3040969 RepID=UPI0036DC2D44
MCCVQCAKCLGGMLIPLILLSVLTNLLLCFPALEIVQYEQLSDEVTYFGGIIGCGIIMCFPAFSFIRLRRIKIRHCFGVDVCGPRCRMFNSIIYAIIGVIGASYGISLAWTAIKKGPKCDMGENRWDYPFYQWFLWNKCKRPVGIVPWNVTLFSIQLAIGCTQLTACIIQILNGLFGTTCGQWKCEKYC